MTTLQHSGDLRARVAGLLLEGKVTGGDPLRPVAEQTRNEVVQLAAGAQDPAVYAMALSVCRTDEDSDPDGACRQLSMRQWAQIDPDNAVPWLLLAGMARMRHDSAAAADAFSNAAAAHKIDSYTDSIFAFAEPELPPDLTPLERYYLAIEVIGVEAGMWFPQYSIASQQRSRDSMLDNVMRTRCNSLAELLVTKGNNLLDLGIGAAIGTRAGWPSERVNGLLTEQHALMQVLIQQSPSENDNMWTCAALARVNTFLVERVRLGELGAARDALERSGETAEDMANKYTQYLENNKRDAPGNEQP